MIPIPDISQTYPKTSLTMDTKFTGPARFVAAGSAYNDAGTGKITVSAASGINALFSSGGTLSMWVNMLSIGATAGYLLDTGSDGIQIFLQNDSSGTAKIRFKVIWTDVSGEWDTNNQVITYGDWTHFAVTYTPTSTTTDPVIYINGKVAANTRSQTPVGSAPSDAADKIFMNTSAGNRGVNGYMANVGLWKGTVLTESQIRNVMLATSYGQVQAIAQPTAYYILSANGNDSTGNFNGTLS